MERREPFLIRELALPATASPCLLGVWSVVTYACVFRQGHCPKPSLHRCRQMKRASPGTATGVGGLSTHPGSVPTSADKVGTLWGNPLFWVREELASGTCTPLLISVVSVIGQDEGLCLGMHLEPQANTCPVWLTDWLPFRNVCPRWVCLSRSPRSFLHLGFYGVVQPVLQVFYLNY